MKLNEPGRQKPEQQISQQQAQPCKTIPPPPFGAQRRQLSWILVLSRGDLNFCVPDTQQCGNKITD